MADTTQDKRSYRPTLNLPRTRFAMKANLVQNEPASLKRWQKANLYQQIRQARQGRPRYVFHDGPPYANGSIHLGHLLNKVLKDFVVRSRTMMDLDCPYTPGWDCHGLPIEHRVVQDLGEKAKTMVAMQIRKRCMDYASKHVKLQGQQMQRLLTMADYDEPYLTMNPSYEAAVLDVFADLVRQGIVYRMLKPVHWSIENRTALAEAELEYYDRDDTSVYVLFEVDNPRALPGSLGAPADQPVHVMIWTTTPWTLPANMAVAAAAKAEYVLARYTQADQTRHVILADALLEQVMQAGGADKVQVLGRCLGSDLADAGLTYRHPFVDRSGPILTADYVTLEDGTGLVHTAPGHGTEDYQTGLKHKLEIYCPVRGDGTLDDTVPGWLQGKSVWDANSLVVEHLRSIGHLFHDHQFTHSYPHDWRGKTPTIFRATEQWFISVDKPMAEHGQSLRQLAMRASDSVQFYPQWGKNRLRGMLESRPDWCISRQRSWGLPIPAFQDDQGHILLTEASVRATAKVIAEKGSDAWFLLEPAELLAHYDPSSDSDAPPQAANWATNRYQSLTKGADIFDVWFDSGCSWAGALKQMQGDYPADLYLEGSDQHRGWFQVSLLCGLGSQGRSPFGTLLTHGFMVDKDGRKMSKSLGNTLEVEDLLKNYGADVCRWWVSSLNTDNDIKVDESFFKLAGESYRKVRNTLRFCLSNLSDFDIHQHRYTFSEADALSIDAWVLGQLDDLIQTVCRGYDAFAFRSLHEAIFNFCNDTLSATYLAATKDRLYCDKADSPRRRRTQTALWQVTDALIRLLAPILPHTAEEAWQALHGDQADSVHLALLPSPTGVVVHADWARLMELRDQTFQSLETARQQADIDNPLDVGFTLTVDEAHRFVKQFDPVDLADLYGISRVVIQDAAEQGGYNVQIDDLRDEPRCERSWKRDGTVQQRSDGGWLSQRDAEALGLA